MAMQIPVYETPQTVSDQLLPGRQMPGQHPDMLSHGLERAAQGATKLNEDLVRQEHEAAAIKITDTENNFNRDALDYLHNSQTGFIVTQKGESAMNTAGVHENLNKMVENYAATLPVGRTRDLFLLKAKAKTAVYHKDVEDHAAKEYGSFAQTTVDQTVTAAQKEAQIYYTDQARLDRLIEETSPIVEAYLRRFKGFDNKQIEQARQQIAATIYLSAGQEFKSRGQGGLGLKFLDTVLGTTKNVDGTERVQTVKDLLGHAGDELQTAFRPMSVQDNAVRMVMQYAADPDFKTPNGTPDFVKIGKVFDAMFVSEMQLGARAKPEEIHFGSTESYHAATDFLNAYGQTWSSRNAAFNGATLQAARSFIDSNTGGMTGAAALSKLATDHDTGMSLVADLQRQGEWTNFQHWVLGQKDALPPDAKQEANMTRALWNIANNEDVYTGMSADEFTGRFMGALHHTHFDAIRHMVFGVLAQKGPVKERLKMGLGQLQGAMREQGLIPKRDGDGGSDVKMGVPSTWTAEQQSVNNLATMLFTQKYMDSMVGGKAPELKELETLYGPIIGQVRSQKPWIIGTRSVTEPLISALAAGRRVEAAIPPLDTSSQQYRQVAADIMAANRLDAAKLWSSGDTERAKLLESKIPTEEEIQNIWQRRMRAEHSKIREMFPGTAPFSEGHPYTEPMIYP
jgi:hypothetical protein